jgi:hypothetical protein
MRCYNGQPDKDLQRELDAHAAIVGRIEAAGYTVTYFPNGEFYQAFDARHLPVTGEHRTVAGVAAELRLEKVWAPGELFMRS